MSSHRTLLAVFLLLTVPAGTAVAGDWRPPAPLEQHPSALGTAHFSMERLHERWAPVMTWHGSRDFAVRLVCDLGLVALALIDCHGLLAERDGRTSQDVLILVPRDEVLSGGEQAAPQFQDLRRRSIEQRMQSI